MRVGVDILPIKSGAYVADIVQLISEERNRPEQTIGEIVCDHMVRGGFTGCLASKNEKSVGFAYGMNWTTPDPWWDMIKVEVGDAFCFEDCWIFAEIAVKQGYRGMGIGARLHDTLVSARPRAKAALSTPRNNQPAITMYERRGWQVLHSGIALLDGKPPYCIMTLSS